MQDRQKYVTDYGILMELFLMVIYQQNPELEHKSYIKKIQNKLDRYHKRRRDMCAVSEARGRRAVKAAETHFKDNSVEISIAALLWLVHNRHKEVLKPYGFNKEAFEQLNRASSAQGAIMSTAKVLNIIEEALYESAE